MIVTGIALGSLTVGGFYLIWKKLPGWLRRYMEKRTLLTDLVAAITTYVLFSGTLAGLFAAAWAGILVSLLLAARHNEWLMEWANKIKDIVDEWLGKVKEYRPSDIVGKEKGRPTLVILQEDSKEAA